MAAPGSLSFDKTSYAPGDTVTITVVDPSRINDVAVTIPSVGGNITGDFKIFAPDQIPTDSGNHVWKLISDTPATGTTIWSTTA